MLAIIKTGGKQYIVKPGDKLKVEKLDKKEGAEISFTDVLLVEKNKKLEIGTPMVKAEVQAKILKHGKFRKFPELCLFGNNLRFRNSSIEDNQ